MIYLGNWCIVFRKRERTVLERQLIARGIDITIGIGRHLFEQLRHHGYEDIEVIVYLMKDDATDPYYDNVEICDPEHCRVVHAICWLIKGGPTQNEWHLNISTNGGDGLDRVESEYNSKYSLDGKLLPWNV